MFRLYILDSDVDELLDIATVTRLCKASVSRTSKLCINPASLFIAQDTVRVAFWTALATRVRGCTVGLYSTHMGIT